MYNLTITASELKTIAKALELAKREAFNNDDEAGCMAAMELSLTLRNIEPEGAARVTTTFDDSRYIASHGKAPRGRGNWSFELVTGEVVFNFKGTLTEAKIEARRHMRETCQSGNRTLYISP